jgi:hypothetical protein
MPGFEFVESAAFGLAASPKSSAPGGAESVGADD